MGKYATSIDEQIEQLEQRGLLITDRSKVEEVLSDIGYYRLGFYLFPFEQSYPCLANRNHAYKINSRIEYAIALYYFDFDLRHILAKYLTRIEIAFRTKIISCISNKYKNSPTWFVDKKVVDSKYADCFDIEYYQALKKKPVIQRHHQKYFNDKFAPAWKTIEFMTLGEVNMLYKNLKYNDDKREISTAFGVNKVAVFESYMEVVRVVRNLCAHGNVLFDMKLHKSVKSGPAIIIDGTNGYTLKTALAVIAYLIESISINRKQEMNEAIKQALDKAELKYKDIRCLVQL